MSVFLSVGSKCYASHAAPWRVTVSMPTGQTDDRYRRGKWRNKWLVTIESILWRYYVVLK